MAFIFQQYDNTEKKLLNIEVKRKECLAQIQVLENRMENLKKYTNYPVEKLKKPLTTSSRYWTST